MPENMKNYKHQNAWEKSKIERKKKIYVGEIRAKMKGCGLKYDCGISYHCIHSKCIVLFRLLLLLLQYTVDVTVVQFNLKTGDFGAKRIHGNIYWSTNKYLMILHFCDLFGFGEISLNFSEINRNWHFYLMRAQIRNQMVFMPQIRMNLTHSKWGKI